MWVRRFNSLIWLFQVLAKLRQWVFRPRLSSVPRNEFKPSGKMHLEVIGIPSTCLLRVTRRFLNKKNLPNFSKSSPNGLQVKKDQNIYNKAQFENPKHLHQTTFETLKYLQQTMFWNCLFRWKWKTVKPYLHWRKSRQASGFKRTKNILHLKNSLGYHDFGHCVKRCLHYGDNCSKLGLFQKSKKVFFGLQNALA